MDAKAAYNQVPVAQECQKYMLFVVLDEDNNARYFYPLLSVTRKLWINEPAGILSKIVGRLIQFNEPRSVYR